MATDSTDDAASCETHCSSVGGIQQGSVAWTYYTDGSNSCACWESFGDDAGTAHSNTDAVSGRFVDEGAPTTDNCGNKCRVFGWVSYQSSVNTLDDCKAACEEYGLSEGMRYQVSNTQCFCAVHLDQELMWDADYITVLY